MFKKGGEPGHLIHGFSNSRIFKIWGGMKNRCSNPNNNIYKFYGGRGIKVCEEWQNFVSFKDWAMNNGYTDSLTIDRINVNGNYEPSNCRWITQKEQCRNYRKNKFITFKNETLCLSEWAEKYNISYKTFYKRLKDGWDFEAALTTPILSKSESAKKNKKAKKVYCKEINIIFESASAASQYFLNKFNKKIGGIPRSCQSPYLKAGGIKWFYFQDEKAD